MTTTEATKILKQTAGADDLTTEREYSALCTPQAEGYLIAAARRVCLPLPRRYSHLLPQIHSYADAVVVVSSID